MEEMKEGGDSGDKKKCVERGKVKEWRWRRWKLERGDGKAETKATNGRSDGGDKESWNGETKKGGTS